MRTLKLPPGKKVFATADTHYSHRGIIRYCLRFPLTEEQKEAICAGSDVPITDEMLRQHNELLLENINRAVGEDDYLIHGGDVGWGGSYGEQMEILGELKHRVRCRNWLIAIGNHDDERALRNTFGAAHVFERFAVVVAGQEAVIDHYPGDSWQKSHHGIWQLFGHVHGALHERRLTQPYWALSQDIGVDLHHTAPWDWQEELVPLMQERHIRWDAYKATLGDKNRGGMAFRRKR